MLVLFIMHNQGLLTVPIFLLLTGSVNSQQRHLFYANNAHSLANLAVFDLTLFEELEVVKGNALLNSTTHQVINSYLEDFRESNGLNQDEGSDSIDLAEVTGNPISAYRLIRRSNVMARPIQKEAKSGNGLKLSDAVVDFPSATTEDRVGVIDAILNIQSSYRMNVTQFAGGDIFGSIGRSRLRGSHCVEIGDRAFDLKRFRAAYEWFQEAQRLAPTDQTAPEEISIEEKINRTAELRAEELSDEDRIKRERIEMQLCSGDDNLKTPQETSGEFCWLELKIHAQYRIGPLKMEFLSRYPAILQVHDAFFPTRTEIMRASGRVLRPSFVDKDGQALTISERSSSTATMPRSVGKRLSRRIGRMVDLNAAGTSHTAEPPQITSYTAGGCYKNHSDAFGPKVGFDTFVGDRLMTFMIYLNRVDKGGYTAFPDARTFVKPIKGSAIFWFNVFSDGSKDNSMYHIGCPVIKGHKWVATKWIRMYDQFLKRKCLLEPKERFQFPVNGQYLPVPTEIRRQRRRRDEAKS